MRPGLLLPALLLPLAACSTPLSESDPVPAALFPHPAGWAQPEAHGRVAGTPPTLTRPAGASSTGWST